MIRKSLPFILIAFLFSGCATVPTREALPTYTIGGISYVSVPALCKMRAIDLEYDTLSGAAVLHKSGHKVSLMAGEHLVLVDGEPLELRHPAIMYQEMLVVPYKFKEDVLDKLFKEVPSAVLPLAIKKVVIDAGHGGNDPGAVGRTGTYEKNINLDIAKRLYSILRQEGIQVVMTRAQDRFVSLPSRVSIANNSGADLFLSIHSNANHVRSLYGFEVYYAGTNADDYKRALWAAQNTPLVFDRSCFAGNSLTLKTILWDMIYAYNRASSVGLARSVCRSVSRSLDCRILGIKGARFYVLKGSRMPAILIEAGFLTNANEERLLKNSAYRQQIAEAIAQGVRSFDEAYRSF